MPGVPGASRAAAALIWAGLGLVLLFLYAPLVPPALHSFEGAGATGPFRVKIRSASFSNVSILPWVLRGVYVPDVITILASLYFILGDIDR